MRSKAREIVFKYLFAELFNPSDEGLFAVLLNDEQLKEEDKVFAKDLLSYCEKEKEIYIEEISALSTSFNLTRIHAADKCSIIVGMAELDNYPDTPKIVIIDEAIKLSAKYSTEKSTDFVNGILAEYARRKRND